MLAFSWDHIGIMLGSFWHHAGTNEIHPKCCGSDFGSRIKISGNLLGQNDQNFEIYPFDWSQVASWGLAAEDDALTIFERKHNMFQAEGDPLPNLLAKPI